MIVNTPLENCSPLDAILIIAMLIMLLKLYQESHPHVDKTLKKTLKKTKRKSRKKRSRRTVGTINDPHNPNPDKYYDYINSVWEELNK